MSAVGTGLVTLACVYGGALIGLGLRRALPEGHLREDSKDVVKVVTGLIATLSAMVLGLLIASAKNSYDAVGEGMKQGSARIIVVDRLLAQYGPEAATARAQLRQHYQQRFDQIFPGGSERRVRNDVFTDDSALQGLQAVLAKLAPATEAQKSLVARIQQQVEEISQTRWMAYEQTSNTIPVAFLAVLISWLTMMFASFGLFAPRNATALTALFLGAFAVATAIFLIEEMTQPFGGMIALSSEPMRNALVVLGK